MSTHRLLVLACAIAWFLLGMHMPAIHNLTSHGEEMPVVVLGAIVLMAVVALASLWRLLRAPQPHAGQH